MNDIYIVAVAALVSLTCIESMALYKGINGKVLTTVVGAICTVVGFCFGQAV